jgi:hypothetical protein
MHLFEGGWLAMVCKAFVESLGGIAVACINQWALSRIKNTRSSFRKRFPRVDYSGGVTKLTNIASHEWAGILLVYLLAVSSPVAQRFLRNHFDDRESQFRRKISNQQKRKSNQRKRKRVLSEHGLLTRGERLTRRNINSESDNSVEENDDDNIQSGPPTDGEPSAQVARCTIEKFIEMCESLLCFHAYYKTGKYWKIGDKSSASMFDKSIRTMMRQVLTTMDRGEKTNNWNIQKFHEILHLPKQISEYGNICNTDAGFGERGLKYWAKRPGRRALKGNTDVFTESTVKRVREHVCLRKAAHIICEKESATLTLEYDSDSSSDCSMKILHGTIDRPVALTAQPVTRQINKKNKQLTTRPKFKVFGETSKEACDVSVYVTTMPYVSTKEALELPEDVLEMFEMEYYSCAETTRPLTECEMNQYTSRVIYLYTEATIHNNVILRAHPNYGGSGPIYDFALVPGSMMTDKNEDTIVPSLPDQNESHLGDMYPHHVPCRVLSFFKDPVDRLEKALVHRCSNRTEWNIERSSVLIESWTLECERKKLYWTNDGLYHENKPMVAGYKEVYCLRPIYRTILLSSIKSGLWAVPDDDIFADYLPLKKESFHVMVVKDREMYWASEWFTVNP